MFQNAPTPPSATNSPIICSGATASLSATCAVGNPVWYDASSVAIPFTGSPFVTTNLVSATTYNVRCESGSCQSSFVAVNVTITPAPTASISYIGSPFAKNASAVSVNFTGTTGGVFTASPAGLTISNTTGEITPISSTLSTYTVTYTILASGGCATFTTTTSVTIGKPFITTWKTDNAGTSNSTSITIPTTGSGYLYDVDWNNDGTFDEFGKTGDATHNYGVVGTYTLAIRGSFPRIYFNNSGDKSKILSVNQWGEIAWTSMERAFMGCNNLTGNASDIPNLSLVTDISSMFRSATTFNQNIGNWNVSTVTNMSNMFRSATAFNQNIGAWNVAAVTNMSNMFFDAQAFNQNLASWNVSATTNMAGIFAFASAFNQNIGAWNIAIATDMTFLFNNSGISKTNYDNILIAWNNSGYTNKDLGDASPLQYCAGQAARTNMVTNKGWTITGDTFSNSCSSEPTGVNASLTSICAGNPVSLSATCAIGTVTWYNQSTGGTSIGTGSPLSQSPTVNITYYAACNDGLVESTRVATSLINVTPSPFAPIASTQNFCNAAPQWSQVASLPGNPRDMAASFSIGNKIYVMGGTNGLPDFWEFDTNTNTWIQKANYPEGPNQGALGLSVNGKGYIIGGLGSSYKKSVYEYNPANNTWTQKTDMPGNARAYMIGFVVGNKIYAGAGLAQGSKDFYEFDPLTNNWTQKADFANGTRIIFSGASFSDGNFGYAGLGYGNGDTQTTDFWKYNPTTNIWTQVANFPSGGRVAPVSSGNNSFGIVGSGNSNNNLTNDFYKYNYATESWTPVLNFTGTSRYRSSGLIVDGNFYFGLGHDGILKNDFWKLTISGNTTVANLVATGINLKWYDAITGGNLLPNTTVIANGTYYVSQTVNACESARTAVNVTVNALPITTPTITPPAILQVCSPNTLTLTASCPVGTVTWSNAATGTSLTLSAAGTYSISATCVINTCSSDASPAVIGLEINSTKTPKPSIIPSSSTICFGASITLIAICPNSKINWTGGATGSAFTVNPTATKSYRVSCTTVGSCPSDSSDATIITVRPKPITPTISTNISTICLGNSTSLTATGCSGSFTWTGGLTGTIITVSPIASKNYKVLCTTTVGCKSDSSTVTTINVNPIPIVPTVANVYIVPNVSTSLSATCASGTPVWYGTANGTISLASGSYLTPILNVNTTYFVACESNVGGSAATNPQNCVSPRASQQVLIDAFDIIQNPTLLFVCGLQNASFSVGATGLSIAYQWQENRGSGWNNINNGGVYGGAKSPTLNIIPAQVSMNNYNYRCIVTNTITSQTKTSNEALLIVTAAALAQNLIMASPIVGITSTFQAIQTISATNKISSAARIEYFAGNSITLSTGFEVSAGSVFKAKIQTPCTNTSNPIPETLEK